MREREREIWGFGERKRGSKKLGKMVAGLYFSICVVVEKLERKSEPRKRGGGIDCMNHNSVIAS